MLSSYRLIVFFIYYLSLASLSHADTVFKFTDVCTSMTPTDWKKINCKGAGKIYDISKQPELFCGYQASFNESLSKIIKKVGYFRGEQNLKLIDAKSGQIKSKILAPNALLLFSKRDLMRLKQKTCVTTKSSQTYYALSLPISIYALKSTLKPIQKNTSQTSKSRADLQKNKHSFEPKVDAFFKSLNSTQISNATSSRISTKLSPSFKLNLNFYKNKKWSFQNQLQYDLNLIQRNDNLFSISKDQVKQIRARFFINYKTKRNLNFALGMGAYEALYYYKINAKDINLDRELIGNLILKTNFNLAKINERPVSINITTGTSVLKNNISHFYSANLNLSYPLSFFKVPLKAHLGVDYDRYKREDLKINSTKVFFSLSKEFNF